MWDVIVLGAGAAGMMAGIEAARRGRRVLVLDHAKAPGEKIRISGGGRCNFTNLGIAPERFLSQNQRFALSALRRLPRVIHRPGRPCGDRLA
jgi:Predicted flavoproteins